MTGPRRGGEDRSRGGTWGGKSALTYGALGNLGAASVPAFQPGPGQSDEVQGIHHRSALDLSLQIIQVPPPPFIQDLFLYGGETAGAKARVSPDAGKKEIFVLATGDGVKIESGVTPQHRTNQSSLV